MLLWIFYIPVLVSAGLTDVHSSDANESIDSDK
jgi:hypothetical protein